MKVSEDDRDEDARVASSPSLSVVVPVRDGGAAFERCLAALAASTFQGYQLVVVDDGSSDGSATLAAERGAMVLRTPRRLGPGGARNLGVERATGELLLFLDADCEIHGDALARIAARFAADRGLDALFGAYDDSPAAPDVVSQFKNLYHHWTHLGAPSRARTFWAGCGAIRRERFLALGGFDAARYPLPSVEDIELGYRLSESGGTILLDPGIRVRHLKRWTLASLVRTDLFRRGVPWTELLLERRGRADQLNVGSRQRWVVAAGALASAALPAALVAPRLLALSAAGALVLVASSRGFYSLVLRKSGIVAAFAALPLHALYCCCCCAAAAIGLVRWTRSPRKKLAHGV